ncbi:hypothetical protein ACOXXX_00030 [Thalassococcus sp. BH17M4-6]|uniref:sunset domain-containing protein n=1 Tax=Thalassococcus sp. BH17M4-6 TaxID=3413148 RepID=UPI003BEBED25
MTEETKVYVRRGLDEIRDTSAGLAAAAGLSSKCRIKGNVSRSSGDRIYHMVGQEFYNQTRIDLLEGERWFCTEAEARAAGWRRARN